MADKEETQEKSKGLEIGISNESHKAKIEALYRQLQVFRNICLLPAMKRKNI